MPLLSKPPPTTQYSWSKWYLTSSWHFNSYILMKHPSVEMMTTLAIQKKATCYHYYNRCCCCCCHREASLRFVCQRLSHLWPLLRRQCCLFFKMKLRKWSNQVFEVNEASMSQHFRPVSDFMKEDQHHHQQQQQQQQLQLPDNKATVGLFLISSL